MADIDLEAVVEAAVSRALGGDPKPAAAPAATSSAAPKGDRLDKLIDLMTIQATAAMASNPAFAPPPGAPSGPIEDEGVPSTWTPETVAAKRKAGTLRQDVERAHGVGAGALFRRTPMGGK